MFRPLLAEKIDLSSARYPGYASPKYDGFRCIIIGGRAMSRNMKPVANAYVYAKIEELKLPDFDGELLTFTGNKVDDFNVVQSKLTKRDGRPDFKYMVFDRVDMMGSPYYDRNTTAAAYIHDKKPKSVEHVQQNYIENEEQLLQFEAECLARGWEGVMFRSMDGHYKQGRSTTREGILLKLKRFFDDEAVVISAHELVSNQNEATVNALGYTTRTSHAENMIGQDTLGKFTVRWKDVEFDIGTGFDSNTRNTYWNHPERMVGQTLTFKYQSVGPNGKPRFPVFKGFRNQL